MSHIITNTPNTHTHTHTHHPLMGGTRSFIDVEDEGGPPNISFPEDEPVSYWPCRACSRQTAQSAVKCLVKHANK